MRLFFAPIPIYYSFKIIITLPLKYFYLSEKCFIICTFAYLTNVFISVILKIFFKVNFKGYSTTLSTLGFMFQ